MAWLLVLLTVAQSTAPEREARQHFRAAEKLYSEGDFERALGEYQAAYKARQLPGFLFNIGQCHRNLGHYKQAIGAFRAYLDTHSQVVQPRSVEGLIAELEKKLASEDGKRATAPPLPKVIPPATDTEIPSALRMQAPVAATETSAQSHHALVGRWWFWAAIGAVAAGTATALVLSSGSNMPSSSIGNIDFR
jgi:tetratricopeptide (TPR) repeat protein